jgi:protein-disulfide isomerase
MVEKQTFLITAAASFLLISAVSGRVSARSPQCDTLSGQNAILAKELLGTINAYGPCRDTIAKCIDKKKPDPLAVRLADNICRHIKDGESGKKIRKRIALRVRSMDLTVSKASIDLSGFPAAGSSDAGVTVVVYACSRCPFCAKLVPELYKSVTSGKLKGRVKLYFKPFPLKSHQYSKEGGLAITTALKLGHYWQYILYMYSHFQLFGVDKLAVWAGETGMDGSRFTEIMNSPEVRKKLVLSKKEGLANDVHATPSLFINGRRYKGFLDIYEIGDILEEESLRSSR